MKELPIISASPESSKEILANLWGGDVTISAEAYAGAGIDTPDSEGGKMEPGDRGEKAKSKDGKAPLPKFNLAAYNGGPMRLGGYQFPVVIDAKGAKSASGLIPIYAGGHPAEDATPAELMDCLAGQAPMACEDDMLTAKGEISGVGETVKKMLQMAANGFKFQNSVHGRPTEMSFIKAGDTAMVNGKLVAGPANVARQSIIDHIAILPLGADTSTSARIAANHAAGEKHMELFAWIKANYGMDEAAYKALPEAAQTKISAAFDTEHKTETKDEPTKLAASGAVPDTDAVIKAQNDAVASNRRRIAAIDAIDGATGFPNITAQAVSENWSVERAENAIIKAQRDALTQQSLRPGKNVSKEMQAAMPKVIAAATLLSCGYKGDLVKDRAYGEQVMTMTDDLYAREGSRVITPSKLARIVARANGVANLPDGHGDDFWSEALASDRICPRGGERMIRAEFSSLSLPVALSNVMNKFVLAGYMSVDPDSCDPLSKAQAWKSICKVSSVQDFKPHYRSRMVATVLLQRLLKGGEIQHGVVGEQSYTLTADTKAIMLGLTRKDLVNDDQSVLSTLPTHFGVGAGRSVANDIWDCFLASLQSDGSTAFYSTTDITTAGNLMKANKIASGAALAFATVEAAHARLAAQTDPTGQPSGILGQVLLVPTALAGTALQINQSERVPVYATTRAAAVGDANTLRGRQKCVASAYLQNGTIKSDGSLRSGSSSKWWLSASANDIAYPIEVGFLNGMENPVIERAEANFNRLGIEFRTFLDYGVSMGEPRSIQQQDA